MYELYDQFIEAYKNGTEGQFEAAAFNYIANESDNPFTGNAAEVFFKAGIMYRRWKTQSISCKRARKELFVLMKELADMDLPNPYRKGEVKEEVVEPEPNTVHEEPEVVETVQLDEPVHVTGVVPEEKKSFFGRHKK